MGDSQAPLPARPRCARCQDVIGAYEPMIVCGPEGHAYETSLAAEPSAREAEGRLYHGACFDLGDVVG